MNGPIKMYRTRQIVNPDIPVQISECMYTLRNIHSRDTRRIVDESTDHVPTSKKKSTIFDQNNHQIPGMADLQAKQEDILKQLAELKNQIQSIKLDLKINSTSSAKLQNNFSAASKEVIGDLHDLVINASPTHPPYSLEILQKLLHDTICLKFTCHLHSSVSTLTSNAQQLEQSLLNYKGRDGIPKIKIRLIWKNVGANTELLVSRVPIVGEVNLLRYLSRVVNSPLSYSSDANCIEIDSVLDTCYLVTKAKTKTERAGHLVSLNKSLGKSEWLAGRSEVSVADIAAYSSLKQAASGSEINANLSKWYIRCETVA